MTKRSPPGRHAGPPPEPAAGVAPSPRPSPHWRWMLPLLLAAAAVVPYLPSLGNGFVYDDMVLIVGQPEPASASDVLAVFARRHHPSGLPYYRPLSALTLMAQKAIWGDDPVPYHLFNLGLLAALALAARALYRSLPAPGARATLPPMGFALLLAWHPLASSVVYAIAGRETLLVLLLLIAGCWAHLRAGRGWRLLVVLCFALALLCKEQAVALPLVLALADWFELSPDSPRRVAGRGARALAWGSRYLPLLLVAVGYALLRHRMIADGASVRLALLDEPARPLLSVAYAATAIFLPRADLLYEPSLAAWWSTGRVVLATGAGAALLALALRFAGSHRRLVWFWLGWALLGLLPSANLVVQETRYDERYVVLPLLGMAGLASGVAMALWQRGRFRTPLAIFMGGLLAALAVASYHRGQFFADDDHFLSQWARADPGSYQARASLAEHLTGRGELLRAIVLQQEALELVHRALPEPQCIKRHFALGDALARVGRYAAAAEQYEEILRMKPEYQGARQRLARVRALAQSAGTAAQLSADGERRLFELLADPGLAGRPVWFAESSADPHSPELRAQLAAVFRRAGWQVRGTERVGFRIKPGLHVFVAAAQAPDYVLRLQRALAAAGLPVASVATDYREYAREAAARRPGWQGFHLASEQEYVLVIGRSRRPDEP